MTAGGVGEDADDVGSSFQFPVQAFDGVVRPDLGPVRWWEPGVGQQVGFHAGQAARDSWCGRLELIDHCPQLRDGGVMVGLHEDRADQRRDQLTLRDGVQLTACCASRARGSVARWSLGSSGRST